jgi:hypothetical protein
MVNTASNVVAGRPLSTGGVLLGPIGTALPTDATLAPNVALLPAGYIGDDGVTQTIGRDTTDIKAWGNDLVKVVQTGHDVSYQFTFIESLNSTVLAAVFGAANVVTTPATSTSGTLRSVKLNSDQLPHMTYVFEVKDGPARVRIVVPDGQITEQGDTVYSDADVIAYQVTVKAFADASGNKTYMYSNDGKTTA